MLNHPTIEKLNALSLKVMAKALTEQWDDPAVAELDFAERLGLLVDRELTDRENRRLRNRLHDAKLRQAACVEDIKHKPGRGIDRSVLNRLADCEWIRRGTHVFITGKTGVGKTYLACALAQLACRNGHSALYMRTSRLFEELALGRGDGRYGRILGNLARKHLLVLDDWGLAPFTDLQRRDLLEILEERQTHKSLVIASQIPVDKWHDAIGDPTLADAILDRIVHYAHEIKLKGESMRKPEHSTVTLPEETKTNGDS
jgi:DNA replication protein DnaC